MDVIGAKEAGELLDLEENTVRAMARKGQLPGYKVGSLWKFDRQELTEWFRDKKHNLEG